MNDGNRMQLTKLSFGKALEALEEGMHVSREGWNGEYIWLLPASPIKAEWCKDEHLKNIALANGGEIQALGSIRMLTANQKILTGWSPSQEDMLSKDWFITKI